MQEKANSGFCVETKNLTKRFKKFEAVKNLNFRIEPGTSFGLLGPNGAGKTTTLLMILGIHQPSAGKVLINQQPVSRDNFSLKRKIGVVAEYQTFYEEMTAWEYLMFFGELFGAGQKEVSAEQLLEELSLYSWRNTLISAFSTGMKKKLGFARALIHSPALLILDEPISGLDPFGVIQVREMIQKRADQGCTIIISSHILSEVEKTVQKVGIMKNGQFMLQDTMANIQFKLQKETHLQLWFENGSPAMMEKIKKLPFVNRVNVTGNQWDVFTLNDQDYRSQVGQFILQNQLIMTEMKRMEISLEEAFIQLSDENINALLEPVK